MTPFSAQFTKLSFCCLQTKALMMHLMCTSVHMEPMVSMACWTLNFAWKVEGLRKKQAPAMVNNAFLLNQVLLGVETRNTYCSLEAHIRMAQWVKEKGLLNKKELISTQPLCVSCCSFVDIISETCKDLWDLNPPLDCVLYGVVIMYILFTVEQGH